MALNIPMHKSKSSAINDKMKKGDTVSKGSLVIERRRSSSHWRLSLASCNVAHRPDNATAFKQSCLQTAGFDRHPCLVSQRRMLPCCCCGAVNFLRAPQRHCLLYLLCTFISVPVPSNARKCHAPAAKLLPDPMLGQVEMAPEVIFFTTGLSCSKMNCAMISTCPINVAHSHLHTSRAAQVVHSWAMLCMSATFKSHAFGIHLLRCRTGSVFRPSLTISSSSSNHPISHLSRIYKPAQSLPALNADTIQLL